MDFMTSLVTSLGGYDYALIIKAKNEANTMDSCLRQRLAEPWPFPNIVLYSVLEIGNASMKNSPSDYANGNWVAQWQYPFHFPPSQIFQTTTFLHP
jgi:hypothetical protein